MFGYVKVYKPELKMKHFAKYRAYYCGLCRTLRENYGLVGQMTLTYDMTFMVILLASLYEGEKSNMKKSSHHCMVHPIRKHEMLQSEVTEYCAAMNVVLAYYHFIDDWEDEKSVSGLTGLILLKKQVKKIELKYPRQCSVIKQSLVELKQLETNQILDLDIVSGCFGKLMAEILILEEDQWEDTLRKVGFYLGKFVYIMDAFDDVEKDLKEHNYNPLKQISKEMTEEVFQQYVHDVLSLMMADCSNEFEKLPCIQDIEILRNILYDGVWTKYNKLVNPFINENEMINS